MNPTPTLSAISGGDNYLTNPTAMSSGNIPGRTRILAPLILSSLLLAIYWRTPDFLAGCEQKVEDLILIHAPIQCVDSSTCVILTGDRSSEKAARADGQAITEIITAVAQGNPRAIGVGDCLSGTDGALEAAVRSAGKAVMGYRFGFDGEEARPETLGAVEKSRIRFVTNPWGKPRRRAKAPRLTLECADTRAVDAAAGCGFANSIPDADGVTRGVPLVAWADDAPYQGFAAALLAVSLGVRRITLEMKGEAIRGIELGGLHIVTDPRGRLRFRECAGGIKLFSAADVLGGRIPPRAFSGKIVLIGSNRRRLHTRSSPSVPEVIIQATAVENALRDDCLRRSRGVGLLEIALIIGIPFVIAHLTGWRRWCAMLGALILIASCAAVLLVCYRQEMRMLYPGISALISWILPPGRRTRALSEKHPHPSFPRLRSGQAPPLRGRWRSFYRSR